MSEQKEYTTLQMAQAGMDAAENTKSTDNRILDLREESLGSDYFVLASGQTRVQTRAIVNNIEERLKKEYGRLGVRQGYRGGNWILLDYGEVIFHIFLEQERRYYNLEQRWKDAPVVYDNPGQ
ncbi:MAG: ribosome silencing factor [Candidatus Xenobia bacterium]